MHQELLFSVLLLFVTNGIFAHPASSSRSSTPPSSLIVSSCARARYPTLCVRTLAPSSPRSPTNLAVASISVSISSIRSTLSSLRRLPSLSGPLRDCLQQLSDSADQLCKTRDELSNLKSETSRMQLDNACTWASAALTNEDTCLDGMKGLEDERVKNAVGKKVRDVEKLTSNALYFVARLASSGGGRKNHP